LSCFVFVVDEQENKKRLTKKSNAEETVFILIKFQQS
jgi:hypothetical protein